MPRFVARYPEVQVELIVEDRDLDVARNGIDISVRSGPPLDQSLVARKLGEFERVVCASPAYLERHGIPRSPGELATHACITISSLPGRARWEFLGASGRQTIEVNPRLSATSADSVRQFALMGLGIVRTNDFNVDQDLRAGRLVPILADQLFPERIPMHALYPHDRHRLPRVAAMLDFLGEIFGCVSWRSIVATTGRRSKRRDKSEAIGGTCGALRSDDRLLEIERVPLRRRLAQRGIFEHAEDLERDRMMAREVAVKVVSSVGKRTGQTGMPRTWWRNSPARNCRRERLRRDRHRPRPAGPYMTSRLAGAGMKVASSPRPRPMATPS